MAMKLFAVAFVLLIANTVANGFTAIDNTCYMGGCWGYPKGCQSTGMSACDALLKWKGVKAGEKNYLDIQLYTKGAAGSAMIYVGGAFSSDEDMPDNPFFACFRNTSSGTGVTIAWGYIVSENSPPIDTTEPATGYITNVDTSYTQSRASATLQCRLRLLMTLSNTKYELKPSPSRYYALGAYGIMASTTVFNKHIHDFHSSNSFILASGNSVYTNTALLMAALVVSKILL